MKRFMKNGNLLIVSAIVAAACVAMAQPSNTQVKICGSGYACFTADKTSENRLLAETRGYQVYEPDWNTGWLLGAFCGSLPFVWILGWAVLRQISRETSRVVNSWEKRED